MKYPSEAQIERKSKRSYTLERFLIAGRFLYSAPAIALQIPLVAIDKLSRGQKYGRRDWSLHFRINKLAFDYLVWSINPGMYPMLKGHTYNARSKCDHGGGKQFATITIEIPADIAEKYIVGDALHEKVKPERCPAFWQFHRTSIDPTVLPVSGHDGRVIMYFVGGGYVQGNPTTLDLAYQVHKSTSTPVFSVGYRKAVTRKYAFPAALLDALSGFAYLLSRGYAPGNITVMGDSAGGGLCITLILHLLRHSFPIPGQAILISPWVDLVSTFRETEELKELSRRDYLNQEMLAAGAWQYTVNRPDLRPTLLSPSRNALPDGYSLKGFPRTLLSWGDAEMFAPSDAEFGRLLTTHGVDVEEFIGVDHVHVFPMYIKDKTSEGSWFSHVNKFMNPQKTTSIDTD